MGGHTRLLLALTTTLLLAPALAGSGLATHSMECPRYVQYVPPDSLENSYPVYVTIDELSGGYLFSIWIYAESNGRQGLQRDDDYCFTGNTTQDTMDTIIF